jgi:hypothetical protein
MNKIYYIKAEPWLPGGDAGAVVIAEDKIKAVELVKPLGFLNPSEPKLIGTSRLKPQIIFSNTGDY